MVAEYDGSWTLLRRYVDGPGTDDPIQWIEGASVTASAVRSLIKDRQGSVIGWSDTTGALQATYTYGPNGEPNSWSGSRFRYTGQIALPELQLYYYKARAYDPIAGRFLQTDPVGYKDGPDWYLYVHDDPLNESDPSGLCDTGTRTKGGSEFCRSSELPEGFGRSDDSAPTKAPTPTLENRIISAISDGRASTLGDYGKGVGEELLGGFLEGGLEGVPVGRIGGEVSKGIGETGVMGEKILKDLGGESQQFFRTSLGSRFVDQFLDGFAHESKVGYTALTASIRKQIAKDVELIKKEQVAGVTWHFFTSPVTGRGGPSKPLEELLRKSGIKIERH